MADDVNRKMRELLAAHQRGGAVAGGSSPTAPRSAGEASSGVAQRPSGGLPPAPEMMFSSVRSRPPASASESPAPEMLSASPRDTLSAATFVPNSPSISTLGGAPVRAQGVPPAAPQGVPAPAEEASSPSAVAQEAPPPSGEEFDLASVTDEQRGAYRAALQAQVAGLSADVLSLYALSIGRTLPNALDEAALDAQDPSTIPGALQGDLDATRAAYNAEIAAMTPEDYPADLQQILEAVENQDGQTPEETRQQVIDYYVDEAVRQDVVGRTMYGMAYNAHLQEQGQPLFDPLLANEAAMAEHEAAAYAYFTSLPVSEQQYFGAQAHTVMESVAQAHSDLVVHVREHGSLSTEGVDPAQMLKDGVLNTHMEAVSVYAYLNQVGAEESGVDAALLEGVRDDFQSRYDAAYQSQIEWIEGEGAEEHDNWLQARRMELRDEFGDTPRNEEEVSRMMQQQLEVGAASRVVDDLARLMAYHQAIELPEGAPGKIEPVEGRDAQIAAGGTYLASMDEADQQALYQYMQGIVLDLPASYERLNAALKAGVDLGSDPAAADAPAQAESPASVDAPAPADVAAEPRFETVMVPDRVRSAQAIEDTQTVQRLVNQAISAVNGNVMVRMGMGISEDLQAMPRTDGQWDEQSLEVLNGILGNMRSGLGVTGDFGDGYSPDLGQAITAAITNDPAKSMIFNTVLPAGDREALMSALDRLYADEELRVVKMVEKRVPVAGSAVSAPAEAASPAGVAPVSAPADPAAPVLASQEGGAPDSSPARDVAGSADSGNTGGGSAGGDRSSAADSGSPDLSADIANVEMVLFGIGQQIQDLEFMQMDGGIFKDLASEIITPLEQADLTDRGFGSKSQDFASKLVMGLKMLGGDQNADGFYNADVGEQLTTAILVDPRFAQIRDSLNEALPGGAKIGFYGSGDGTVTQAQQDHFALLRSLAHEGAPEAPAQGASAEAQAAYEQRKRLYDEHKAEIDGIRTLNQFFNSMTALEQNGIYDNDQASAVNKNNMMLDVAAGLLDDYAPGIKAWIKDFFTNSDLGRMVAGFIGQFAGMDVARLWGDTSSSASTEAQLAAIEDGFEKYYTAAEAELGIGASSADIVAQAKDAMHDKMTKGFSGFAFGRTMKLLFKGQDEDFVQRTLEEAMDAAASGANQEQAQELFMQHVQQALGQNRYQAPGVDEMKKEASDIREDALEQGFGDRVAPLRTQAPASDAGSEGLLMAAAAGSSGADAFAPASLNVSAAGGPRVGPATDVAVDGELVEVGNQRVELVYVENDDQWLQGKKRFSHGRVDDLQEVLAKNADKLGLSLNTDGMKIQDRFSDMATPYTCAVIEEMLIRAQLAELETFEQSITQEVLDGLDRTLSADNLDLVTGYMEDQGVSAADIARFRDNVTNLADDYFSTDVNDRTAGERQEHSVLEQAFFGGQFELHVSQFAPAPVEAPVVQSEEHRPEETQPDPLRDRYLEHNQGRDCEVPLFFMKEGSHSVFAIIRDKKDTETPGDDQFREIEFDYYRLQNAIQNSDRADMQALFDNYTWRNETEDGVRAVINKVLGLSPSRFTVDLGRDFGEATRELGAKPHPDDLERKPPESYRQFLRMTDKQADAVAERLGLADNKVVGSAARKNQRHLLETLFEKSADTLYRVGASPRTPVIFLELGEHGIEVPGVDVVMARRGGNGKWDFRVVDYEKDKIRPLHEQRSGGPDDIREIVNPAAAARGERRLDHVLRYYMKDSEIQFRDGAHKGYLSMAAILTGDGRTHFDFNVVDGLSGVYGPARGKALVGDYSEAMLKNYNQLGAYETRMRVRAMREAAGHRGRGYDETAADRERWARLVGQDHVDGDGAAADADAGTKGAFNQESGGFWAGVADFFTQNAEDVCPDEGGIGGDGGMGFGFKAPDANSRHALHK